MAAGRVRTSTVPIWMLVRALVEIALTGRSRGCSTAEAAVFVDSYDPLSRAWDSQQGRQPAVPRRPARPMALSEQLDLG